MLEPEERDRILERPREFCLALPESDCHFGLWCAAPDGLQTTLIDADHASQVTICHLGSLVQKGPVEAARAVS